MSARDSKLVAQALSKASFVITLTLFALLSVCSVNNGYAAPQVPDTPPGDAAQGEPSAPGDSTKQDETSRKEGYEDAPSRERDDPDVGGNFIAPNPDNVQTTYELAPDGEGYIVREQVNGEDIRPPSYITRKQLEELRERKARDNFFQEEERSAQGRGAAGNSLIPPINVNSNLFKTIFGSPRIDIKPNVSVLLDFSIRRNVMKNPALSIRQQRNTTFFFDQQIQLNVVGSVGERLKLNLNYDTEATFDFENQYKIGFQGDKDDILKSVEAGNVSLPVNGSLIQGGQNLWGVKIATQWGPLFVTTVASQQRGKTQEIVVNGGGQQTNFDVSGSDYDYNRHFFLNNYFRSIYEQSLSQLPAVNSPIQITRIEVWVTNRNNASTQNNRNAIGFVDLAENTENSGGNIWNDGFINASSNRPGNSANNLYSLLSGNNQANNRNAANDFLEAQGLENGPDFELVENMRLLSPNEYVLNSQLGYISLNSRLQPNDVLFVAYEYTVAGSNEPQKVGEFTQDKPQDQNNQNLLFLKMLKPSSIRPTLDDRPYPTWDLMMKNVYSIGGYNLQSDGFRMDLVYEATDGSGDINYLPTSEVANTPLVQVFGIDQLTNNMEQGPDNIFDFIPNVTVLPDKGVVIFPVLQPFGSHLVNQFGPPGSQARGRDSTQYAFQPLYNRTQQDAIQYFPQLDRYKFTGYYTGAGGSEIYLNSVQVTEGSVTVTAGGTQLQEGSDYNVDYQIGKVTILNPGVMSSGQEIRVRFESNDLFGVDQKSLLGVRLDYKEFEDFTLGGTMLYLNERPLINKINIGDEPMSNVIWGLDASWRKESRFLTKLVDLLPFHDTKTPSSINAQGEFAHLIPGQPRAIQTDGENGIAYVDDFEGTRATLNLMATQQWALASRPPEIPTDPNDPLSDGYRRAALSWYRIDPSFYDFPQEFGLESDSPELNEPYTRRISPQEVFPNRNNLPGQNILATFDLHYRPSVRGPYNYETSGTRLNADGEFTQPEDNWAGIQRRTTQNTDFEAANFEFIEIWMFDPYLDDAGEPVGDGGNTGELVLNLGKVSEDILPDNRRAFEHGLPTTEDDNTTGTGLTTTDWGRVSDLQVVTNAFDNEPEARRFQDVGYDGLKDSDEQAFFDEFLQAVSGVVQGDALAKLQADPSSDGYAHYRDSEFAVPIDGAATYTEELNSIQQRYRYFNGQEGNSPIQDAGLNYTRQATPNPDVEDLNADATLSTAESYWEYRIPIDRESLPPQADAGESSNPFLVDVRDTSGIELPDGSVTRGRYYQIRIPLRAGTPKNGIQDFKAIDYVRMYMKGFTDEMNMRFARFELVSTQWRQDLVVGREGDPVGPGGIPEPGQTIGPESDNYLELGTINIEDNGSRLPYNYSLPPRIERQIVPGSPVEGLFQNEQALVMRTFNLQDGNWRAAFRSFNFDLRNYGTFKLWAHTERIEGCGGKTVRECGDMTMLVRLGSDYTNNYYEYEVALCPPDPEQIVIDPNNPSDFKREQLWQNIEFDLQQLNVVKQARNDSGFPRTQIFEQVVNDTAVVRVVGTPMLNQTQNVWVGIKNPSDDGAAVCAEVWLNEIRVTDFNQENAWAANARVNMKLADFASVQASVSKQTAFFGGVEQQISQRSFDDRFRYDIAANINGGMLLPKQLNLEIPFYISIGEEFINPVYNPLDPDVELEAVIESLRDRGFEEEAQEKLEESQTYTRNFSYSFNNVRVLPGENKEKSFPWDIQNFAFTYGYNERFRRTPQIEFHMTQNYTGAIQYQYQFPQKTVEPFKNVGKGRNLISAINFNFWPQTVSVRMEGNRHYEEQRLRAVSEQNLLITPTYNQNFLIKRQYNMRWNLTRSLNFNYTAMADARVDEPKGRIEGESRDTLFNNLLSFGEDPNNPYPKYNRINFGRMLNFTQTMQFTYRLPFNLIEPLNWINTSANYNANLNWQSASLDNQNLGNNIQNGRTLQMNAQFNLGNLYRKFPIVKEILKPIPKKNIYSKTDSTREKGDGFKTGLSRVGKFFGGMLFSVKSLDFTYSINQNTQLAGYLHAPTCSGSISISKTTTATLRWGRAWLHFWRPTRAARCVLANDGHPQWLVYE